MSYKSWKRREQRRKLKKRLDFWKDYRSEQAIKAFNKWKLKHLGKLIEEYRNTDT